MGTRSWGRIAAVVAVGSVVAVALFGAAAPAPAGNRGPLSELAVVAGLDEVTAGQGVALIAKLVNRQKSTFTDVRFSAPIPAGSTLTTTDCPQFELLPAENPSEFLCHWGHQLRAGDTAKVVYVVETPADGGSTFTGSGAWLIKEGGQQSGAPDTFPTNDVVVPLIAANNPSKAGAYVTTSCTDPSSPTLATSQALGPDNPLSTSVCAPNLPVATLGLPTSILERDALPSDPGVTQVSEVCMPAPTFGCDPGYTPFVFSSVATFTFVIRNASLPAGETIDKVFHDGVLVSKNSRADPRVVSIKVQPFKGITTVVTQSSTNGSWTFS